MFSDDYKKDMENLSLDDKFLNELKNKMRTKQKEIEADSITDLQENSVIHLNVSTTKLSHGKAFRVVRTISGICAAGVLLFLLPGLLHNNMKTGMSKDEEKSLSDSTNFDYNTFDSECVTEHNTVSNDLKSESNSDSAVESDISSDNYEDTKHDFKEHQSIMQPTGNVPNVVSYEDSNLDLYAVNHYVDSDGSELELTKKEFSKLQQGTDFVSLDYAYDGRVILHDYYGMIVYDYNKQELLRAVDLQSYIGDFTTQGDSTLEVTVFEGGNYVLLKKMNASKKDAIYCYIYDVQMNRFISLTYNEYQKQSFPNVDSHLSYEHSRFDSFLPNGMRSLNTGLLDNQTECTLLYDDKGDLNVSSLTLFCVKFDQKGNMMDYKKYPIYK